MFRDVMGGYPKPYVHKYHEINIVFEYNFPPKERVLGIIVRIFL
jgi:hypothetical protein